MGIEPKQLQRLTVDVLRSIGYHSEEAVDLLMLTAAQESEMGKYLYQLDGGPARGIFQMEPRTHRCLYENVLKHRVDLLRKAESFLGVRNFMAHVDLVGNIPYQIVVCRFQYYRFPERIPRRDDFEDESGFHEFAYIAALAKYWKKYWNTKDGKGRVGDAIRNYYKYVLNRKLHK